MRISKIYSQESGTFPVVWVFRPSDECLTNKEKYLSKCYRGLVSGLERDAASRMTSDEKWKIYWENSLKAAL
jgi:hypothetical protein